MNIREVNLLKTLNRKILIAAAFFIVSGLALFLIGPHFTPFQSWKPRNNNVRDYNLLLISIDTLRADFVGSYGNSSVSTPNIDSMARQGVLLENFYSTVDTTLPAHSSMFTGLYPRNHGVARNGMRLNRGNVTLAEILAHQGYATAAFIGSFSLASVFGIDQGFEVFDESSIGKMDEVKIKVARNRESKKVEFVSDWDEISSYRRPADRVNASFFQWLDTHKQERFFAFVHYYDSHFPYQSPEKWLKRQTRQVSKTPFALIPDVMKAYLAQRNPGPLLSPADFENTDFPDSIQAWIHRYAAAIEYCDFSVGEILRKLEKENLLSKTLVVVTSDHGETMTDHPEFDYYFNHGMLTYQSEAHIPCVLYCPALLQKGLRVRSLASLVDLLPTLAETLGFDVPTKSDGVSLWKELSDDVAKKRMIFTEASRPLLSSDGFKQNLWLNDQNSISIRSGNYEYVRIPWNGLEALFDLSKDPLEREDLLLKRVDKPQGAVNQFRAKLVLWQSSALIGSVDTRFKLSSKDLEKLRSLGYVGYTN